MALLITGLQVVQHGRRARESKSLQSQTGNQSLAILVRKYLYSHDSFFQIGVWYVACYGKVFVLFYFIWKFVIDKTRKHEYFWVFLICTMPPFVWETVSCILICKVFPFLYKLARLFWSLVKNGQIIVLAR